VAVEFVGGGADLVQRPDGGEEKHGRGYKVASGEGKAAFPERPVLWYKGS
jgi:hypothetical protein